MITFLVFCSSLWPLTWPYAISNSCNCSLSQARVSPKLFAIFLFLLASHTNQSRLPVTGPRECKSADSSNQCCEPARLFPDLQPWCSAAQTWMPLSEASHIVYFASQSADSANSWSSTGRCCSCRVSSFFSLQLHKKIAFCWKQDVVSIWGLRTTVLIGG